MDRNGALRISLILCFGNLFVDEMQSSKDTSKVTEQNVVVYCINVSLNCFLIWGRNGLGAKRPVLFGPKLSVITTVHAFPRDSHLIEIYKYSC